MNKLYSKINCDLAHVYVATSHYGLVRDKNQRFSKLGILHIKLKEKKSDTI